MKAHRPAIIIPAYKRAKTLSRLLDSINKASYPDEGVNLFISIDGGAANEVVELASKFQFEGGICHVVRREKNIGLRDHLLWCGNQSQEFGSVVVLEDDLVVDPHFYRYAMAALAEYNEVDGVAGISLYAQRYNEYVGLPFEPMYNGTSAYFMKIPCSWGQAWTGRQWAVFKQWLEDGDRAKVENCVALPPIVKKWPESSWKKYYAAFLAETSRYVVYPYQSYTSNCADYLGTHMKDRTNLYQVPLGQAMRKCEAFNFPVFADDALSYDSFMEPGVGHTGRFLGMHPDSLEIDMYGYKPAELIRRKKYVLTSRHVSEAIASYPLAHKPIEKNVEYPCGMEGAFFCLAETNEVDYSVLPKYAELMDYGAYFPLVTRRSMFYLLKRFSHEVWKALSRRN
jgi:glycosyltransferase involved in cell wall biosynthesis